MVFFLLKGRKMLQVASILFTLGEGEEKTASFRFTGGGGGGGGGAEASILSTWGEVKIQMLGLQWRE